MKKTALQVAVEAAKKKAAAKRPKPAPASSPAPPPKWDGMCPKGKHGLDFKGQECDACAAEDAEAETQQEAANILKASELPPIELLQKPTVKLTLDEAETVRTALVETRHLLELVLAPLIGPCGTLHPSTKVEHALREAERLVANAIRKS